MFYATAFGMLVGFFLVGFWEQIHVSPGSQTVGNTVKLCWLLNCLSLSLHGTYFVHFWYMKIKHLPITGEMRSHHLTPWVSTCRTLSSFSSTLLFHTILTDFFSKSYWNVAEMNVTISLILQVTVEFRLNQQSIYRTGECSCHRVKIKQTLVPLLGFICIFLRCLSFSLELGTQLRALGMLEKCSIADLYSQTLN